MSSTTKTAPATAKLNPSVKTVLTEIADAELALLKGPLLTGAQQLTSPGVNLLSAQNVLAGLAFQLPQLSGPAQTALLNVLGSAMVDWINEVPTLGASSAAGSAGSDA